MDWWNALTEEQRARARPTPRSSPRRGTTTNALCHSFRIERGQRNDECRRRSRRAARLPAPSSQHAWRLLPNGSGNCRPSEGAPGGWSRRTSGRRFDCRYEKPRTCRMTKRRSPHRTLVPWLIDKLEVKRWTSTRGEPSRATFSCAHFPTLIVSSAQRRARPGVSGTPFKPRDNRLRTQLSRRSSAKPQCPGRSA
jgi:hypothetical protein